MPWFAPCRIQILNRLTANLDGVFITLRTHTSFGYSSSSLQLSRPTGHREAGPYDKLIDRDAVDNSIEVEKPERVRYASNRMLLVRHDKNAVPICRWLVK